MIMTSSPQNTARESALRNMLDARRREVLGALQGQLRQARRDSPCECGDEIAEARLRALPFALRCKDCEELHELRERHRRGRVRKGAGALFREASLLG